MTRVLIAADESEDCLRAATAARKLFGDDAHYMVVHVADTAVALWGADPMTWGVAYPMMVPAAAQGGTMPLVMTPAAGGGDQPNDAVVAEARAHEVAESADLPDAEAIGEVGDPATAIVKAADEHDADVIVVGSPERGWLTRLLQPSVTKAVVRESNRPVLVVP